MKYGAGAVTQIRDIEFRTSGSLRTLEFRKLVYRARAMQGFEPGEEAIHFYPAGEHWADWEAVEHFPFLALRGDTP